MSATLYLPAALPHQQEVLDSPHRFKVWRAGRRTGKSRTGFIAATLGHGKGRFKGMLTGGDVLWLTPDYPQSRAIWREEIKPRFGSVPGVTLHETDRMVSVLGGGSLELRSAENVDSARGRKLDGVVIDEAGYLDLEYAIKSVILPALLDRGGWLLVNSTPNIGWDGNKGRVTPSYFNRLCVQVEAGGRGPEWGHWHHTTEANPKLSRADVAALRAEYPANSATSQQEIDASLNATGGLFYPELSGDIERWFVPRERLPLYLPPHWAFWSGYDWGFSHPAVWVPMALDGRTTYVLDALYLHREQDANQAAAIKGRLIAPNNPDGTIPAATSQRCYAGHDAFAKRQAHVVMPETVADVFEKFGTHLDRASLDREAGSKAIRRLFSNDAVRFIDTPGTRRLFAELAALVPDPKRPNAPLKRDADDAGEGGDDGFDAFRYAVATYPYVVEEPAGPAPATVPGHDATDWRTLVQIEDERPVELAGGMLM